MGCMFIKFESELSLPKPPPQKSMAAIDLNIILREKTPLFELKNKVSTLRT